MACWRWPLYAGLCLLLCACLGCGDAAYVLQSGTGSTIPDGSTPLGSTPVLAAPTAPATITAVFPAAVQAGSGATTVTLFATGIGAGATVLVDGASHAATLVSSTAARVTLSANEVATGTRHTFAIQNPALAPSNATTVLVTSGYWAFGDSITYGFGLPDPSTGNYAFLLASAYRLLLVNSARSGDQACDVWAQMYASRAGYTKQAAPLFSLMIGTNDVDHKATGAYESVFTACDQAALSWLGTPRTAKVLAGDATISASGACGSAADASLLGALRCAGTSGTVAATLTTSGSPIYVWYLISDNASSPDSVSVTLDGSAQGSFATKPAVSIATINGGTQGIAVVRLPAAAGTHTVTLSTSGFAGVLGFGTNPRTGADRPRLLVGDLPNQAEGTPVAPIEQQLVYIDHTVEVEQQMQADGMDVHRAFTRTSMLGTVFEMADQLHPNALGQRGLEKAFNAALP